ncbi:MAG: SDR family oxidoreductase [Rhodobacteraceae bacterium]|nr:SDR family oxidoreductase [Paracoccaceae bacterium]
MKKLAIVTGASSGIGAAAARALSKAGHPLLLTARRLEKLEALGLPNAMCRAVDVRDTAAMDVAIKEAEAEYGPVDLLVNNAGLMQLGDITQQDPTEWKDMFDINVTALLEVTRLVLPGMQERKCGTITNISSIAGRNVYGDHTAYCGTKFAVHAISESLRREVAKFGVRVIIIGPGMIETELLDHTNSDSIMDGYLDYKQSIGGGIPSEDVADTILWSYQMPQRACLREILIAPTSHDC